MELATQSAEPQLPQNDVLSRLPLFAARSAEQGDPLVSESASAGT